MLVGKEAMEKLTNSHVIIFGIGGVGSFVAESLIRAGIGQLTFVDYDEVCITNLNRQVHATRQTVGKDKVEVMKERALLINPKIKINSLKLLYNDETHEEIFSKKFDFVVDAIDMVTSKIKLAKYCYENNIKIIPINGPSSIILALISSGFNGQEFTFNGYLPIDREQKKKQIQFLENQVQKTGYSQIFMETPYRNNQLHLREFLQLFQSHVDLL
jgi:molybdopterin/thiamine biosynthesis adenylyltransferase